MAQQLINRGLSPGDGTGDTGYVGAGKINANFTELYAQTTGGTLFGYVAATLAAGTYNDLNPGGTFPSQINRVDINPSTGNVTLTGLLAGVDGQQVLIRNIGTTYSLILNTENSSSNVANRFFGAGNAMAFPPHFRIYCVYYTSPNPRWSIG